MIEEGDPVALRGDAQVADPTARLVEDLSDRKLQAILLRDRRG